MSGVNQSTEEYFKDGSWGRHGGVWRKQSVLMGVESVFASRTSEMNANAGNTVLSGAAVPSGKMLVVSNVCIFNGTTAMDKIIFFVAGGMATTYIKVQYALAIGEPLTWSGQMPLRNPEYVAAVFYTCVAGDDLYIDLRGYYMNIE